MASVARQLVAEGLGTGILLATVVGSGIMGETMSADPGIALWGNTAATGAILVVLILIFGPISGAHLNPAVTLAFRIRGDIGNGLASAFVLVQVVGAVAGALLAHFMFEDALVQVSTTSRLGPGQWVSEGVATFALIAAIFGCVRYKPDAVPYAVGLVITAGYWWTSSTSFANPAVTIARTLTDTFSGIRAIDAPGFLLAQFGAALLTTPFLIWLFDMKKSD